MYMQHLALRSIGVQTLAFYLQYLLFIASMVILSAKISGASKLLDHDALAL
jgi:hypothetical protein